MKKYLVVSLVLGAMAFASSSFAAVISSKSFSTQVNFTRGGVSPAFDVYAVETGGTPVTDLNFGNQGTDVVGTVKKITIAKRYVAITPGDAKWNLIVYTKNTLASPDNDSNLYWDNDSKIKMIWKYRNSLGLDKDATAVGSTIVNADWTGDAATYKWFVNAPLGSAQLNADAKTYTTIATYRDVADILAQGRLQLVFGVDLSSTYLHGVYKTTVGFEMYTN